MQIPGGEVALAEVCESIADPGTSELDRIIGRKIVQQFAALGYQPAVEVHGHNLEVTEFGLFITSPILAQATLEIEEGETNEALLIPEGATYDDYHANHADRREGIPQSYSHYFYGQIGDHMRRRDVQTLVGLTHRRLANAAARREHAQTSQATIEDPASMFFLKTYWNYVRPIDDESTEYDTAHLVWFTDEMLEKNFHGLEPGERSTFPST